LKLFENIKNAARAHALRKSFAGQDRRKQMINLGKATTVGILFEVPDDAAYQSVYQYIQKLQEMKIKVRALGYVKEKHLSTHFLPVLSFDFIYQKDLNCYGKPTSRRPEEFWALEFDICINIGSPGCFPLKYIASRSIARLRVGPFTEMDKAYYDLMIQPEDPHDPVKFLQQVHDYLMILNPKENG
jgi:hypothetical protein